MKEEVSIQDLEYTDDMTLVSDSMDVLEEVLRTLHTTCSGMRLSICCKTSKILAVCPNNSSSMQPRAVQLCSDEVPVAVVEDFEYLGCTISHDCSLDQEISKRISKASQTFRSLYRVLWCQKRLKTKTKLRLFQAIVLSTLLYGSETWAPLAKHTKRLQAFIMDCLRVVLGVTRWDKMRNTQLLSLGGLDRVEVMIMRRRLCWLGHLERMEDPRLPRCLLACQPAFGKRSVGGLEEKME